jgi:hypothetical protein
MQSAVAIVAYRCEVGGKPTDSLDIQVRYFAEYSHTDIEQRIRAESPHTYANDDGEVVSWPLVKILSIEPLENLSDGREVAGFIAGHDEFEKWTRP